MSTLTQRLAASVLIAHCESLADRANIGRAERKALSDVIEAAKRAFATPIVILAHDADYEDELEAVATEMAQ